MPRPKKSERDAIRSDTRQRLLDAAAAEFAAEGYVGANVNRISQAAGFAKGTIYNYFASKRALMEALIEEIGALHVAYIAERVRAVDEPQQRLTRFFEAGFAFVSDYLPQARLMLNTLYGPDEALKQAMYTAYLPLFELVGREIVGEGMAQGVFRQADPEAMGGLLMTIYLGTASQPDAEGRLYLDASLVADFAMHALQRHDE